MKLTPAQERAVRTEGRDLCVLAGAGSGKTRVLVERVAHMVLGREDPAPLASILAITFTEKAAREMKQRLAERFEAAERLDLRAEVEWAYVSTIHGFCARLLRENAVEAAVDPSFTVLDEVQADALRREATDRVSGVWAEEREAGREAILGLGIPDSRFVEEVLGLYAEIRASGLRPSDVAVPEGDPGRLRAILEHIVDQVESVEEMLPDLPEKSAARGRDAMAALPAVRALVAGEPGFAEVSEALRGLESALYLRVAKELKEVLKHVKKDAIPDARREAAELLAGPCIAALLAFLGELDVWYREEKRELGALDFSDLEIESLKLLEGSEEVREGVRRRFLQILVDEYQDVNPVQARIIGLVRGESNHFAVGDVKQSIYGFRHAEPEIFRARADEAGEEGRIVLPENFRSSPGIVEFTNHLFSRLFAGQELIDWEDMVPAADYAPAEEPEVEILVTEGDAAREAREAEANAVASRIRALVSTGGTRLRRAGERRGRPVRFGDVAVLLRALTDVKTYERAFEDLDIPFYVVKGRGYYQAREMVDLLCLLRAVANPRDEISLAAALRSPFAGVTDDGLLALVLEARRRGRGSRLSDLLGGAGPPPGLRAGDRDAFARFVALLERLRRLAARDGLRRLIEVALDDSGYRTAVRLLPGGRRRAANLQKALALAESFEGLFDLPSFLDTLADFRAREVRETEAPTGGEQEDVVRILSIHGAKGLEFPVVVLPDLSRRPFVESSALRFGGGTVGARIAAEPGGESEETTTWRRLKDEQTARDEAETLRLLYVAVTRAEEKLVLSARSGKAGRPGGSFWSILGSVLDLDESGAAYGSEGRVAVQVRIEEAGPATPRVRVASGKLAPLAAAEPLEPTLEAAREHARELRARASRPRPEPDATSYENTISELLAFADCAACWYDRYVLGIQEEFEGRRASPDDIGPPDGPGADELPPREIGSLVHEALRTWDPHGGESLREVVDRRTEDGALADRVLGMVESFYASEVGREVLAAPASEVRRELPFLVRWTPPGLLLRGQIDLLYPAPDGTLRIVDYKTGGPAGGTYRLQLAAYARSLPLLRPGLEPEDVSAVLVYLRPGEPARIEDVNLSGELRRQVEKKAAEFAAARRAGAAKPAGHSPSCSITSRGTS